VGVGAQGAADAGDPQADEPHRGGAGQGERRRPHLEQRERHRHDEEARPDGAEHRDVPGGVVAEGMARDEERGPEGAGDADRACYREEPRRAGTPQLDVAPQRRADLRAHPLAQPARGALVLQAASWIAAIRPAA
jgi:hypothetical protein